MICAIKGPVIFSICIKKECFFIKELIAFIQEADYTKDSVKAGTEYVKEYVIEQEGEQQQVNLDKLFVLLKNVATEQQRLGTRLCSDNCCVFLFFFASRALRHSDIDIRHCFLHLFAKGIASCTYIVCFCWNFFCIVCLYVA